MRTHPLSKWLTQGTYPRLYVPIVLIMVAVTLVRYHALVGAEREQAQLRMRAELQAAAYAVLQALDEPAGNAAAQERLRQAAQVADAPIQSIRWELPSRPAVDLRNAMPPTKAPPWFVQLLDLPTPRHTVAHRLADGRTGQLALALWPQHYVDRAWSAMATQLRITALNIFTILLLLTLILRANDRMLDRMRHAAERFKQGHLDARIRRTGTLEAREIADTFNDMAGKVQSLVLSLQETQRQQNEQLHFRRQLVNALPLPLFVLGADGAHLETNKAWRELLNASRPSTVAGTLDQLWADGVDSSIVLAQRLSDRPSGWQTTVRPLQGVPHEMACYHATFTAPDGVPAGTIGVLVDMTEHTQALQAERAGRACAEAALDTVADGVITMDAQGLVRTINGAAQRVIGLAQGQTVGRHVDEVFRLEPPHSVLAASGTQGHAAHGAGAAATAILACHSGAPRTVDYSVAAVHAPDGTAAGHVLVFRPR